ncbi:YfhO family protein [Tenacibaculum sp. TC6]|uniref:YfhO family protein n=1 Tax=Tenacibaculum sp. TC6 TaxID=3423223 RepID=UPI003D35D8FE
MQYKKILPYAIAVVVFTIASLLYFNPVLSGKKIKQGDITQFIGMARESSNYRAEKGKESYWLGNAFSGMPTYQVGAYFPNDFIRYVDKAIRFLPRPADYLFLYFLSFFILLTALKVDWKLAILGSLSFGFSTYLIIIFGAGHNAKAHAIGYMPLVIAGIIYVYQKRYLLGFILTSLAIALEVAANHPQMTYYLGFCLLILGIVEFIQAIKNKTLPVYAKETGIILIACLLGVGVNATRLLATKEYAAHSTRGKSELTINTDGTLKEKSSGLDKEYITEYSYGIAETFNLLIPRFMGGGTVEKLDGTSHFYETIEAKAGTEAAEEYSNQVLTYWGKQPIVEAPAYIGAILFFLFFLGIFLVKGKLKYWLVSATVFSIIMSWGKNFPIPTDLFIDYFPLYNKFRAVSSIQVIAELCVPLLGIIALRDFFSSEISKEEKENALKKSFYVVGGITLLLALLGGSLFNFEGIRDAQYQQLPGLIDALIADRKSMLMYDSLRSFMLVLITGGILWFFLKKKVNQTQVIVALTIFIVFDLVSVNLNYVNKEDFTLARNVDKPFVANEADKQILKDTTHYRVANFTGNILNEARTSYFHNSIGGYHAAKMKRYQEIFEYQISKNNFEVLNMLNTKYFIVGEDKVKENPEANGNAWFINQLILVDTADEEMKELDSLKTKTTAVLTKKEYGKSDLEGKVDFEKDSTAYVKLTNYDVARLTYKSASQKEQFAVFSEIYYQEGWNAYVDGSLMPHVRVDYILRGMKIPAGEHVIEFKFEPTVISKGSTISVIAYILLILIPVGGYLMMKKNKAA